MLIKNSAEGYRIREELLNCPEKYSNYNSFNASHKLEITSSYFHIFMSQNQTRNTHSTRLLWSWKFAKYSLALYFLSFHQTTHGTAIDVLHTLEHTSCIESEPNKKMQILHLKLHWSKCAKSHLSKCFPGLIWLCHINCFAEPFSIILAKLLC